MIDICLPACSCLRNSSAKSEKSLGRMNVVGMHSRSRSAAAQPNSAARSALTRSSSFLYRLRFLTIRSLRVSS
eukprot:scaffold977_cov38-Phaeocystis_antarctica.AAC.3